MKKTLVITLLLILLFSCTVDQGQSKSGNADLAGITIVEGTLSPDFAPEITEYTLNVGHDVASLDFDTQSANSKASVSVSPGLPVSLDVGTNDIAVTVTAENGDTKTYQITVNRAAPDQYTITFDKNSDEATGSMPGQNITENTTASLTECTFHRPGYIFNGWAEMTDGSVVFSDGAEYSMGIKDVTLYACWTLVVSDPDDFTYNVIGDEITITDYTGSDNEVVIPDTIDGYPVKIIGSFAFSNCTDVTFVKIPDSVTTINNFVFSSCDSLTYIDLPSSVSSISSTAFNRCDYLAAINVDDANLSYSSSNGILYNKTAKTLIKVPPAYIGTDFIIHDSVTAIDTGAFRNCINFDSISIPDSVESIGTEAFYGCSGLTSIVIPSSVDIIPNGMLSHCSGLTSVTIPDSITTIDVSAFNGCNRLEEINVNSANTVYSSLNGVLFNKSQTELILFPQANATDYSIPNTVTVIGQSAFMNCSNLSSLIIPVGIVTIESHAFNNCTGLTSICLPETSKTLGDWVLGYCSNLESVSVQCSIAEYGLWDFYGCSSLSILNLYSDTAPNLSDNDFYGVTNCTLHIPAGATGYDVAPWTDTTIFSSIVEDL